VIADRTIGLLSASLLALLVLPLPGNRVNPLIALVAGVIAVGTPAMFWFLARYATAGLNTLSRTLPFLRPVASHHKVHEFIAALTAYSPRALVQAFVVSLVFAISNAVTYACIGAALHIDLPLAYYVLVSPIITLVLLIPISVNGLGTRDAAYQVLFIPAGVTSDGALAMSLAYHALNLLAAIAGGVVYAIIGTSETLTGSERL
jgi:uncharacterized membrane protein YbhN (UPF0104 family)